ncbi:MAG: alpha/beta hydrolase [Planctomycetota bacterium]|jgi:hypothetical protein
MRKTPAALAGLVLALNGPLSADTYVVRLDPSVAGPVAPDETVRGRLILFFVTQTSGRWQWVDPIRGPFWHRPQPIASIEVGALPPGGSVTIDGRAVAFPDSLDTLDGPIRVQALLDVDDTERSHLAGPGNLYSDVVGVELSADTDETVALTLVHRVEPPAPVSDRDNLKWIEVESKLLSASYGRAVHHRAGVALPAGYLRSDPRRERWPVVYVIPGFGGRHQGAARYARMLERGRGIPQAVYVVLDPESPLGHHGFVDSPNHGPRGTALVRELIPHLESEFRLAPNPEGRIVTGHSSGGWTALWLQLRWPEIFGGCWASAPDPVDFSAFQMSNLYEDASLYVDAAGNPVPSLREASDAGGPPAVRMTVRQEALMEYVMHPRGGSGQQWDAWEAMFSPADPDTGYPRPMFDPLGGAIDREVVEHWSRFDITRLVTEDWERYGPLVTGRVRLACGENDSFYLERAVARFKTMVEKLAGEDDGPGYIWLVPGATHGSIQRHTRERWNREMIEHLRHRGLHD